MIIRLSDFTQKELDNKELMRDKDFILSKAISEEKKFSIAPMTEGNNVNRA